MKIKMEHNKKKFRILSIFITIIFIASTILPVSVNAVNNNSQIPEIKVSYDGIKPSIPKVGQEFTVKYKIDPQPFSYQDSKPKEIVLVLDTSHSMGDEINQSCDGYCYYCKECDKYFYTTPDEHRNERPYANHKIGIDWYGYYCRDCNKRIDNEETHRAEQPYYNHNSIEKNNYCKEHNTNKNHYTTKIYELKKAAKNFVDSLSSFPTDGQTPKVKNLKIGIVTYNNSGDTNKNLVEVTASNSINENNIKDLKNIIDNLRADGGTNTGDGLRKGAYLLNESNGADKTIIFMGDGEPTFYSSDSSGNYYKELNNSNYYLGGTGYSDYNGKCLKYATTIGEKIKNKKYNVFSIGYGLGDENSDANNKMKQIHESMGGVSSGENSTFFPTDEGAIDTVFQKIADTIIKTSFDDVKLNLSLGDSITSVNGIELKDGNNGIVKINPIVYTRNNNNKYTAPSQEIEFTVRANKEGEIPLLKEGSKVSYTDINGNLKEINMESTTIKIEPYEPTGKEIRILEVEPADNFKLNIGSNNKTGTTTTQRNGYEIIVEHISMPEFIGKRTKLNGKYDAIVIGRYVDKDATNNEYQFNDYSGLENDITDLKANEIKDFINSGQLVYLDSSLRNTNTRKLYKLLGDYYNQTTDNLIKNMGVNDYYNEITLDKVIDKYIERIAQNPKLKRPKLVVPEKPVGDSQDDDLGDIDKRKMKFKINLNDLKDEDVKIKLYLDINGDGLFEDEEAVKVMDKVKITDGNYSFNYNFYNDYPEFIGYLDWRIEVSKPKVSGFNNPIISYTDGNILFRRVEKQKRKMKVLQVSPYRRYELHDDQRKNLNLAENREFKELLNELKDYDIKVDVISYEDFYDGRYYGPGNQHLKKSDYDIVIAGFSDCYSDKMNQKALDEIKDYIRAGQGLMLTHDTLWYKLEDIRYSNKLIKQFRDFVGQSRYKDIYNNENELDFDGKNKIPHDPYESYGTAREAIGSTLWARGNETDVNNSNSTEVYRVNKSLITNYPFELGESIRVRRTHGQYLQLNLEDENVIPWFTLTDNNENNSDDNTPDEGSNSAHIANKYDPRNNFYTYSRGNITFSGTGENSREDCPYPRSELKLFVNTIVKAERGANHKPTITALENVNEIPSNKDLNFKAIVKDIDGDKVKVDSIKVKLEQDDKDKYEDISNLNNLPSKLKSQGSSFDLKIPSKYFNDKVNKEVNIEIVAEDEKGAQRTKEYTVVPTLEALLVAADQPVQGLTGDQREFKIQLERKNDDSSDKITDVVEIKNIEYNSQNIKEDIKDVNIEKENNEYYLVGKLTPLRQLTGEKINIKVGYKSSGEAKECNAKVVVDSKDGEVRVNIMGSNNENLNISPDVNLNNKTTNNNYTLKASKTDGKAIFKQMISGNYQVDIPNVPGYTVQNTNSITFDLNYENNIKEINIILIPEVSDVKHGLYKGINSVPEDGSNKYFAKGASIPFAATFETQASTTVKLNISSGLKISGKAKIYSITDNGKLNEGTEIKIGEDIQIQATGKMIVLYNAVWEKDIGQEKYTNSIKVGQGEAVEASIKVGSDELPELF